jgi:nicotinamidase-related amidase
VPLIAHEDCLLVVIDAQPGFLEGADDALERTAWLVALARDLDVPVVVTEEEPDRNGATDPRIVQAMPPGAPVFTKPTFGLAGTPEILDAVLAAERRVAVLVGAETDVCVYQSAVGLLDAGLDVIAVEDAIFSPGEMHERGLVRLRDAGVSLTHCKALAYEWVRTVDRLSALPRPAPFPL